MDSNINTNENIIDLFENLKTDFTKINNKINNFFQENNKTILNYTQIQKEEIINMINEVDNNKNEFLNLIKNFEKIESQIDGINTLQIKVSKLKEFLINKYKINS